MRRIADERPGLVAEVLAQVRDRGPIAASELTAERPRRSGPWWDWSDSKRALEWLFWSGPGELGATPALRAPLRPARAGAAGGGAGARRRRPSPRRSASCVRIAARSPRGRRRARPARLLPPPGRRDAKPRVAELVEAGELMPVEVEGWGRTRGYLCGRGADPAPGRRRGPDRPLRLADLGAQPGRADLRLRATGWRSTSRRPSAATATTCCPFLLGDRLVARVDLKADRAAGVLRVRAHPPRGRRARGNPRCAASRAGADRRVARPRARAEDLSRSLSLLQKVKRCSHEAGSGKGNDHAAAARTPRRLDPLPRHDRDDRRRRRRRRAGLPAPPPRRRVRRASARSPRWSRPAACPAASTRSR